jgi:hypothetical protein
MAYAPSNNWWLNGPRNPRGWGCDSGECGAGFAGLGQVTSPAVCLDGTQPNGLTGCDDGSTPTCPVVGTSFNGINCSTTSLLIGNPLLPVGSSATIIPGVANQYILLGGAALALILLLGLKK